MGSAENDSVIDFDTSLLKEAPPSTKDEKIENQSRLDKYRQSILILKKKTISSDYLIQRYYKKKGKLHESEKNLYVTKEECKKICLDYRNALETCSRLENDILIIQNQNKDLKEKCFNFENQCVALKSHANQLQQLISDYETQIDALKLEHKLSLPNDKVNDKITEKQLKTVKEENNTLRKHISLLKDVVFGKKKLKSKHKLLFDKYDKYEGSSSESEEEEIANDDYDFGVSPSPIHEDEEVPETCSKEIGEVQVPITAAILISNKEENHILETSRLYENDGSSIDTGRGSSLAFSDSEKCYQSPSYFSNNSPLSDTSESATTVTKCTDAATSPICFTETVQASTSPIIFEDTHDSKATQYEYNKDDDTVSDNTKITNADSFSMQRLLSPTKNNVSLKSIFSPLKDKVAGESKNVRIDKKTEKIANSTTIREAQCLELNNSHNFCDDNSNDCEIQTILQKMRLNCKIITPIPKTPAKAVKESSSRLDIIKKQIENGTQFVCPDAAALKEENIKLSARISELAKEVMNIQNMLKNNVILQKKSVDCFTELNFETDNSDPIVINNDTNDMGENELPSGQKTAVNLHENEILILPSISSTQDTDIHENDDLFVQNPNDVVQINNTSTVQSNNSTVPEIIKTSCVRIAFEDSIANPVELKSNNQNVIIPNTNVKTFRSTDLESKNYCRRTFRRVKLTKLGKLKKRMVPKSKIKRDISQSTRIRKRLRPKPIIVKMKRRVLDSDNSASLNDKTIYEKAVKIMTELKTKQRANNSECTLNSKKIKDFTKDKTSNMNSLLGLLGDIESSKKHVSCPKTPIQAICNKEVNHANNDIINEVYTTDTRQNCNKYNSENESPCKMIDIKSNHLFDKDKLVNITPNKFKASELNNDQTEKVTVQFNNNSNSTNSTSGLNNCYYKNENNIKNLKTSLKNTPKLLEPNYEFYKKASSEINISTADKTAASSEDHSDRVKTLNTVPMLNTTTLANIDCSDKVISKNIVNNLNATILSNNDQFDKSNSKQNDMTLNTPIVSSNEYSENGTTQDILTGKSVSDNDHNKKTKDKALVLNKTPMVDDVSDSDEFEDNLLSTNEPSEFLDISNNEGENKISCLSKSSVVECKSKKSGPGSEISNNTLKTVTVVLEKNIIVKNIEDVEALAPEKRKNLKRNSEDKLETPSKRILRSSTIHIRPKENDKTKSESGISITKERGWNNTRNIDSLEHEKCRDNTLTVSYNDLDMFSEEGNNTNSTKIPNCGSRLLTNKNSNLYQEISTESSYKESVLCTMIQKHGVAKVIFCKKKVSESAVTTITEKLEEDIKKIIELSPAAAKNTMDDLVSNLQSYNFKEVISGLINYMQNPQRKAELFKKVNTPPAPPMSKSEQVLLYVILQLKSSWPSIDFVDKVFSSIEYSLFAINRTPEFNVIESMSHFYAVLCRYFKAKSRLRLFVLDAMYCLQYKSVPIIRQCMDVWMHILPLAHMGIAKSPLVTCLVYLLHFYKCEDKFNRVTEIRSILSRKYFFNISDWNESTILEMFRTAILELKGNTLDTKMLRMALVILGKRQGPRWCQKNIINSLLKPIIEKANVREHVRVFCISLLGPLMKPYPVDMKVHCQIVMNELVDMLHTPVSKVVAEAILTSLLCMSKHNQNHVIQALLNWKANEVSPELEDMLKDFVKSKPLKVWKTLLPRITK